jgi:hypothetical protein
MAVQYLTEVRGTDLSGPIERLFRSLPWIREINRLSAKMELEWRAVWAPEEEEKTSSAEILADEIAYWPYSARPEGYYEAEWKAIVEEKEGNGM